MNESAATVFIEDLVNKSNLSPDFKKHLKMLCVPAVLSLLYKGNGEVVMVPPKVRVDLTSGDIKRMAEDAVIY